MKSWCNSSPWHPFYQVPPPQKAPMEYPGQLKQIERQHNHFYNPSLQQYPGPQSYMPPPGHPGHMYNNPNINHVSSPSLLAWNLLLLSRLANGTRCCTALVNELIVSAEMFLGYRVCILAACVITFYFRSFYHCSVRSVMKSRCSTLSASIVIVISRGVTCVPITSHHTV